MHNTSKKLNNNERDSNLELFRIVSMILIVSHHYVVNSGLLDIIYIDLMSWRSLSLLVFGAWGKAGINCFVMITGYFMCKSQITGRKFLKLLFEIIFYKIVIYIIFLGCGYEILSVKRILQVLLPIYSVDCDFVQSFLMFFLLIPFLNVLIRNITERQHILLLLLLCFIYVFFGTMKAFDVFNITMNYISWFIVIYITSSYIRLYPKKWFSNKLICGLILLFWIFLSMLSIVVCTWYLSITGKHWPYDFVMDANTFLAYMIGVFAFLFFKNIHLKNNRIINIIAASTFGVLMIHANSDAMRVWLWKDIIDVVGHYNDKMMPLYAIASVIIVFTVCVIIDIIRIVLLEKPIFILLDKHWNSITEKVKMMEERVFKAINI